MPHAVQCDGGYTCCPEGTLCKNTGSNWNVVSTCTSNDTAVPVPAWPYIVGSSVEIGEEVCKTGPPVPYRPAPAKNVLVIGDSVSIGYTPFIAAALNASGTFVQHSPWGGDGGAEETLFGARCIDNLIRAPDGTPLSPDVLMFNWGLHNSLSGNCTPPCIPGQSGPPAEYAPYLEKIVTFLQTAPALANTKLLFAITSPDLCNAAIDTIQVSLNKQAAAVMARHKIPTVDLYAAITKECGAVPQAECFKQRGCFCPHCGPAGYEWLATSTLVPAIQAML